MWRREMVVGSYIPRWVRVRQGDKLCSAIAFTVDPHHPCYTGSLAPDQMIRILATAKGEIGSSADYLRQTVEGLQQNGICDRHLTVLQRHVEQFRQQ
jgi:cation transport protein ChaC